MRMHITTDNPEDAAAILMARMREQGGEWIVNAMQKEGFMAAQVGSPAGNSLERSMSPCLCGPFSALWDLGFVEADMREANEIGRAMKTSAAGRSKPGRPRNDGEPKGDEIPVVQILRERPLAVVPLAAMLDWKPKKAADHIRSLRRRGHVVVAGVEPTPGSHNHADRHVYKAVA